MIFIFHWSSGSISKINFSRTSRLKLHVQFMRHQIRRAGPSAVWVETNRPPTKTWLFPPPKRKWFEADKIWIVTVPANQRRHRRPTTTMAEISQTYVEWNELVSIWRRARPYTYFCSERPKSKFCVAHTQSTLGAKVSVLCRRHTSQIVSMQIVRTAARRVM